MSKQSTIVALLAGFTLLAPHAASAAESLIAPTNLFQQPGFAKEFVGSYGILSDVEPEVSDTEQTLLTRLQALFADSKFKEAEDQLILYIKETEKPTDPNLQPGEMSPALVYVLGNLYFQSERLEDARRAFLEAIRRFPKFRRAYTNLGYLYTSQNKLDDALASFQKAVELGEKSSRVMGMLGYCYMSKQNAIAAENAYRQAYLLDPNSRDWKLGLSQTLLMQEKFDEAASMFGNLIKENPQDRQLWMRQTSAYLSMEKKQEAILNLEMLRLLQLSDEKSLNLLGNLYMDQSQPQLALNAYSDAMAVSPKLDVPQAIKSARILNDFGSTEEAAEMIRKIRASAGTMLLADQIALDLAEVKVASARNQPDQAGVILNRLAKENPANPEILLELARYFDQLAKAEPNEETMRTHIGQAKTNYLLAAQYDSTAYVANLGYGQLLVRDNRTIEALPYIEKALSLKSSENLIQYTARVRRAADREKTRKENEEAAREQTKK
jgi:tetratricopeptide (TPR) repeat protein